jgi:quercetin dioxygenase-like cupin family protein
MRISRLYTGSDGRSQWDEVELETETRHRGLFSLPAETSSVQFVTLPGGGTSDWHTSPCRQYVVTLAGEADLEVGDGTRRHFGPGSIFLGEDIEGQGHRGHYSAEPRTVMIVALTE